VMLTESSDAWSWRLWEQDREDAWRRPGM